MMRINNLAALAGSLFFIGAATAQQPKTNPSADKAIDIPLNAAHWQNDSSKVVFETINGTPVMRLLPMAGFTRLKDFDFTTGTIEFDW